MPFGMIRAGDVLRAQMCRAVSIENRFAIADKKNALLFT
jgi:hypothetical protein